jgi:hypothetical protein
VNARAPKPETTVDRIERKLTREFERIGCHPERNAKEIAENLQGWTPQHWAEFFVLVGEQPADVVVIGLVVDRFAGRAERERLTSDAEPIYSGDRDTRVWS